MRGWHDVIAEVVMTLAIALVLLYAFGVLPW